VSQRTHEIGIRMALGADRSGLVRMMVLQAMMPVVVGLAIGSFGALALSGALRGPLRLLKRGKNPGLGPGRTSAV